MTAIDVHVRQKDLAAFRRRVLYHYKKKPKHEYLEVLFVRRGLGVFYIESFHKIKLTKTTQFTIDYDEAEMTALKKEAAASGLEFGTIHTHTWGDGSPSETDHESGVAEGEAIMGICRVTKSETGKMSTQVLFWLPQSTCRINEIVD